MNKYPYLLVISWMVKQNKKWFQIGTEHAFYKRLMDWWEKTALVEIKATDNLKDLRQLIDVIPVWGDAYLMAQAKFDRLKQS